MAKVDLRKLGVLEKLVEDGTGKASSRIMEIFYSYVKTHGFEVNCDILNTAEPGTNNICLQVAKEYTTTANGEMLEIVRFNRLRARINIDDAKKHESFYIIVLNQDLAEAIMEHQDFIEKKLFGNNKVKIVDYENESEESRQRRAERCARSMQWEPIIY